MRDGSVVQLYAKQDHTYVGLSEDGSVVTMANGRSPYSEDITPLPHPLCPLLPHPVLPVHTVGVESCHAPLDIVFVSLCFAAQFEIHDLGACIYSLFAHNRPNCLLRVINGATLGKVRHWVR